MITNERRPWLLDLATRHRGDADRTEGGYDGVRQMRMLHQSDAVMLTKKADRESGEDQKDRW